MSRSTLYRRIRSGEIQKRDCPDGSGVEVRLSCLPAKVQSALAANQRSDTKHITGKVRKEVLLELGGRRAKLAQRWLKLTPKARNSEPGAAIRQEWADCVPEAALEAAPSEGKKRSVRTIERRVNDYLTQQDAGAPEEEAVLALLGKLKPRAHSEKDKLPEDALAYIHQLYLADRAGTIKQVYKAYTNVAKTKGWPSRSYSVICHIIDGIPGDIAIRARWGTRYYEGNAAPFIQRDWTDLEPGARLCGDHHQLDLFVRDEHTGDVLRPWLTAWQCMRSRALFGWQFSRQPNAKVINNALAHAIMNKRRPEYAKMCGLPDEVYVDNGKDYKAKSFQGSDDANDLSMGMLNAFGIEVIHALPYNAKAKPVERFFCTLCAQFSSAFKDAYVGSNASERSEAVRKALALHKAYMEGKAKSSPLWTMQQLAERFELWLFQYHCEAHGGLFEGGRKLSPIQAIDLYRDRAPRVPTNHAIELALMEPRKVTVHKNGIKLDGLWYSDADWTIADYFGHQVEARRHPQEAWRVFVSDLKGHFICEAISQAALKTKASAVDISEYNKSRRAAMKKRREAEKVLMEACPDDVLPLGDALVLGVPAAPDTPAAPESIPQVTPFDGSRRAKMVRDKRPQEKFYNSPADEYEDIHSVGVIPADMTFEEWQAAHASHFREFKKLVDRGVADKNGFQAWERKKWDASRAPVGDQKSRLISIAGGDAELAEEECSGAAHRHSDISGGSR